MALEPITRAEQIMSGKSLEPITREEMFLAKAAGMDVDTPEPITRREMFLSQISGGGGSGGSGGWVVCEDAEVTKATTIDKLQGVRLSLPNATSIGSNAFNGCADLTSIDIPAAESIGDNAFNGCTDLTSIDLPAAESIGDRAFAYCTNLSTLILPNPETVCQLIVTAVLGTKIVTAEGAPTGEGFIYVPSALYEGYVELIAYQAEQLVGDAATAEYIARAVLRKIEDYPEICG